MGKGAYFFVQIIWQFLFATMFWFVYLYNASISSAGDGDATTSLIMTVGGPGLYLLLTIVYMVFGSRKVSRWRGYLIIVVILFTLAMAVAGFYAASFSAPYLAGWFGMESFTAPTSIFSVFGISV